jgi:hypothetical protein
VAGGNALQAEMIWIGGPLTHFIDPVVLAIQGAEV